MRCLCCNKSVPDNLPSCPRCGFTMFKVIGNSPDQQKAIDMLVDMHRRQFLEKYDIGIQAYYWKDQDGTIVLDSTRRLSFGHAAGLQENAVWLDQQFARIPDVEHINVELSICTEGSEASAIQVKLPMLQEKELLQIGAELDKQLQLRLLLKNESSQTSSEPVAMLGD